MADQNRRAPTSTPATLLSRAQKATVSTDSLQSLSPAGSAAAMSTEQHVADDQQQQNSQDEDEQPQGSWSDRLQSYVDEEAQFELPHMRAVDESAPPDHDDSSEAAEEADDINDPSTNYVGIINLK